MAQNGGFELKDLLGLFSVIGEVYAFTAKHSGAALITIGIVSGILAIIWGILESNNQRRFLKAVAILFVILGIVGVLFFGSVAVVIAAGERPAPDGVEAVQQPADMTLEGQGTTAEIAQSYKLSFLDGEHVKVTFMPAPESRALIETMEVVGVRDIPQGQGGRLTNLQNGEKEVAYELKNPSPRFTAVLDFKIKLDQPRSQPTAKVLVTYQYTRQPCYWRISKWIFDRFGE